MVHLLYNLMVAHLVDYPIVDIDDRHHGMELCLHDQMEVHRSADLEGKLLFYDHDDQTLLVGHCSQDLLWDIHCENAQDVHTFHPLMVLVILLCDTHLFSVNHPDSVLFQLHHDLDHHNAFHRGRMEKSGQNDHHL